MRKNIWNKISVALAGCAAVIFVGWSVGAMSHRAMDTAKIESIVGHKGKLNEKSGVFKISVPREDLNLTIAGVKMNPDMGLTSWAAFQGSGQHTMVMGDMVVLESQVNPVMSAALDNGLAVTALHNHFFWDSPKVMFMHVEGMGSAEALAGAIAKVFAEIQHTSGGSMHPSDANIDPDQTSLDPKKIDSALGHSGTMAHGVYKVVIGRTTRMHGQQVGSDMGVNTWAAFAGSDDHAIVDGDFAIEEQELQGVLKALRGGGINIVAIHNHMTGESPRIIFLHYWGVGPTAQLAGTIKTALNSEHAHGAISGH